MRVDERLDPGALGLVANLEDVHKRERAILLGDVLEGRLGEVLLVERRVQLLLRGRDRVLGRDGGRSGRDLGLGRGDEGAAERDDLVVLDRDVGDGVGDGDAVVQLLDVHVRRGLAVGRRVDGDGVGIEVDLGLHEGNGRVLDGSVGTLRQGVVDTSPESLMENM